MPEDEQRLQRFSLTGEIPQERLLALLGYIGRLGGKVLFESQSPLVSPSIALELLPGMNGLLTPVVTTDSVSEFLQSEGMNQSVANSQASQFCWPLSVHLIQEHYHYGSSGRYQHPISPCDCPLQAVQAIDGFGFRHEELEPWGLVQLSKRDEHGIRSLNMRRFGTKKIGLLRRLSDRIERDMSVYVDKLDDS